MAFSPFGVMQMRPCYRNFDYPHRIMDRDFDYPLRIMDRDSDYPHRIVDRDSDYPHRIMDQDFGLGLLDRDLLPPVMYRGYLIRPRTEGNVCLSGSSEVISEKDKFQVMLNVKQFKPEEISVKTVDNCIVIHGKHEEKQDEHGFISREFTRRYMLPHGVESESVISSYSPDGVLTISAPRKVLEPPAENERVVPIAVQQPTAVEPPKGEEYYQ